jgi:acetylornithine deacetylase
MTGSNADSLSGAPTTNLLALLRQLVAFRTDNPISDERPLAAFLAERLRALSPDEVVTAEVPRGEGSGMGAYVFARWGTPRLLVNAHIDTVPPNLGWSGDPLDLRQVGDRVIGLGAADTKGSIAAILSALEEVRPRNLAVLFSGDEERGTHCLTAFLHSGLGAGIPQAIVCEPTSLRPGTRHRGILSMEVRVSGPGGHSAYADTTRALLAELSRVAVALDSWGRSLRESGPPGFPGMCLNIAKLDGGVAFNVIPAEAKLTVSVRCPPGADAKSVREELVAIAQREIPDANVTIPLDQPPFGTRDLAAFEPWLGDVVRSPIDLGFWTEAALLSASGIDAVVVGPGDIAQAHSPDEWVTIEQLIRARDLFVNIFRKTQ